MIALETMPETQRLVYDTIAAQPEGCTVPELAKRLKKPISTINTHCLMLSAGGNILRAGKTAIETVGRKGWVYATRENLATSKAWIAKNEATRGEKPVEPKRRAKVETVKRIKAGVAARKKPRTKTITEVLTEGRAETEAKRKAAKAKRDAASRAKRKAAKSAKLDAEIDAQPPHAAAG